MTIEICNPEMQAYAEASYAPIVHAAPGRPFVIAQLGQSLDGRIATVTGESKWINGRGALDHVHHLRAIVDGVVVGACTAIADDPMLTVRRVSGRNPARIVIDPSGRVPAAARCLASDGARRIVVSGREMRCEDGVEVIPLPCVDGKIRCEDIVGALFSRGLRRLLIEGGAATVSAFIGAGAIDRLHVLVAPLVIGSGKIGIDLPAIAHLAEARRPKVQTYQLPGGDVLFDCDMRAKKD